MAFSPFSKYFVAQSEQLMTTQDGADPITAVSGGRQRGEAWAGAGGWQDRGPGRKLCLTSCVTEGDVAAEPA